MMNRSTFNILTGVRLFGGPSCLCITTHLINES
jgi:hypothetical protein